MVKNPIMKLSAQKEISRKKESHPKNKIPKIENKLATTKEIIDMYINKKDI